MEIIKNELVGHIFEYDLDGTIEEAIQKLEGFKQQYPNKQLKIRTDVGRDYDGERKVNIEIFYERPENKKEKNDRLKQEDRYKEARRQQYEHLKKEFE